MVCREEDEGEGKMHLESRVIENFHGVECGEQPSSVFLGGLQDCS